MHDILKWIHNIWLIHLTDGSWWKRCTFKSNRKPKKIAQIESVMRYRGNTFILLPYTFTYKCASIQAIKLIRLIYWAWIHSREKKVERNIRKLYLYIMHYVQRGIQAQRTPLYVCVYHNSERNDVYHTRYWSHALFCVFVIETKREQRTKKNTTRAHTHKRAD